MDLLCILCATVYINSTTLATRSEGIGTTVPIRVRIRIRSWLIRVVFGSNASNVIVDVMTSDLEA